MNNIYAPYTFAEYKLFLLENGITDNFEFDWCYKIYLAVYNNNEHQLQIAMDSYYWNALLRMQGRYN